MSRTLSISSPLTFLIAFLTTSVSASLNYLQFANCIMLPHTNTFWVIPVPMFERIFLYQMVILSRFMIVTTALWSILWFLQEEEKLPFISLRPMGISLEKHKALYICLHCFLDCVTLLRQKTCFSFFSKYSYGLAHGACSTNNCPINGFLSLTQNIRTEAIVPLVIIFIYCDYRNKCNWRLEIY